jgi:hypothetical protein
MWNLSEDKKMKRLILISMSALCMLAACTPAQKPEIQEPTENVIHFTATLAPKGENPLSKAITTGTEGGKEVLNVAWAEGEEIAVYYQTSGDPATATATVQSVTNGVATITADLTGAINGGSVSLVYPATLHNGTGGIDESKLLNQNGNLTGANGVSTKFDAATGDGTIIVNGTEATLNGNISLTNQVCICKFRFHLDAGSTAIQDEFRNVIIFDGNGHTYTITSDKTDEMFGGTRYFRNTDDIYVALLPVSGKVVTFYYTTSGTSQGHSVQWNYLHTSGNTTLSAGKFYRNIGTINLVRDEFTAGQFTFKDLSAGSITASSGDIIWQSGGAIANSITIGDGAKVRLHGVNISGAGIFCSGNATINLAGTNTVTNTDISSPAIQAGGSGTTLTIQGSGSMIVTGGDGGAGIGSGFQQSCGDIVIKSGAITANGGDSGAGIGSGAGAGSGVNQTTCGNITISGGTVTATGGHAAAGIGCGISARCGDITITNGVNSVTATKGKAASYSIGKGDSTYSICGTITIGGTVYYDGTNFLNDGDIYLTNNIDYRP